MVGLKLTKIRVISQENTDNFSQVKTNNKPAETCRRWDPMRTFQSSFLSYLNCKLLLCFTDRSSLLRKQCFQFCYRYSVSRVVFACKCLRNRPTLCLCRRHRSSLLRKWNFQFCCGVGLRFLRLYWFGCVLGIPSVPLGLPLPRSSGLRSLGNLVSIFAPGDWKVVLLVNYRCLSLAESFQVCSRQLEGCVVKCYCCIFSQTLLFR